MRIQAIENTMKTELYYTYDQCDGEVFAIFDTEEAAIADAEDCGCHWGSARFIVKGEKSEDK